MKRGNAWLSSDATVLALRCEEGKQTPPEFDVVVVGSGYGGAVAAARLSGLNLKGETKGTVSVCVLERGREYTPGSFPTKLTDLISHQRLSARSDQFLQSNAEGLMDWRIGGDVAALVANGLGGGSLINAGVCEPADTSVLNKAEWPAPWNNNPGLWTALYGRARGGLGATPWPANQVPKQAVMTDLADRLGGKCQTVSLSIIPPVGFHQAHLDAVPQGVPQAQCIECGDCFTGCNVGAKLTLSHTYLARAYTNGAQFYCGATVRHVERDGSGQWIVTYELTEPMRLPADSERPVQFKVRAKHVVLAAGTYGSTEILLRSREKGLALSPKLGQHFSANGDVLSAYYDYGQSVQGAPDESTPLAMRHIGPTITSQVQWAPAAGSDVSGRLQDLTVPGALGWVFREITTTMMVPQRWSRWNWGCERRTDPDPYAVDEAAVQRTLLTVSYVDDGALGQLVWQSQGMDKNRSRNLIVHWPKSDKHTGMSNLDTTLAQACPKGGFLLRNPLWQFMPKPKYLGIGQSTRSLLTVHPLGGCRMADTAAQGVVDAHGRVFDPSNPVGGVHDGLYVLDGSIIPTALGINPLLTITAVAEGAIDQWTVSQGWIAAVPAQPQSLPVLRLPPIPGPPPPAPAQPTELGITERMSGRLAPLPGIDRTRTYRLSGRFEFDPLQNVQTFLANANRQLGLTAEFKVGRERPSARQARFQTDAPVSISPAHPNCSGLRGTVEWFVTEPSWVGKRFVNSLWTLLSQRACADLMGEAASKAAAKANAKASNADAPKFDQGSKRWEQLRALTHFGAVRRLAYRFEPLPSPWTVIDDGEREFTLPAGTVLKGTKRVGYRTFISGDPESSNPWRQLLEMPLQAELPDGRELDLAQLNFDDMGALGRYDMPIKVLQQDNALAAMRDILSLGLYFARAMAGLHMLTWRRPDYPADFRVPDKPLVLPKLKRLPPAAADVATDPRFLGLQITTHPVPIQIQVNGQPRPIVLQLTRLRKTNAQSLGLPTLLIHGFGSGGVQFTHTAIKQPMAPWLAQQGRDVWVAELRTSIGLRCSWKQWLMDEVAREDIPALIAKICEVTGEAQVHIVAHCIGAAMFSMATLGGNLSVNGQSRIASAVLMQVGPKIALPRSSRARAYVARRMQQLLALGRAHSVASQRPSDAESVLDRVLSGYLYPRLQRKPYRMSASPLQMAKRWLAGEATCSITLQDNHRRTNANRSAAIFGQLFEYENMNPALLDQLEDVLGHCNMTTYEQTAYYASSERITDQLGNDAYVTTDNLQQHFNFPVLLLHGLRNKTFDKRTLVRNRELFQSAGLRVSTALIRNHGHLDCVVGQHAATAVFPKIAAFLAAQPSPLRSTVELRLPSVGPWIGHVVPPTMQGGPLQIRVGLRLEDLGRRLSGLTTLACGLSGAAPVTYPVPVAGQHEQSLDILLPLPNAAQAMPTVEVLVAAAHGAAAPSTADMISAIHRKVDRLGADAVRLGRPAEAISGLILDSHWLNRILEAQPTDLGLVLGACRQRPLLVDRDLADRSMGHVLQQLAPGADSQGHAPIDALILCGDQVYADSRAESMLPAFSGAGIFDAYREAWSAPHQREVMRRRPTYMTIDDHEFRNDFNDQITARYPIEYGHAKTAWQRYQIEPGPAAPAVGARWRELKLRGFEIFLADTRSDRFDPPTADRSSARIMSDAQMTALTTWLGHRQADPTCANKPKVIVFGTPIAPWYAEAAAGPGTAILSDGWQRFPASVADLLSFIGEHQIQNVLFLSGDYHRFAEVELTIRTSGKPEVKATSIVTSGLYCPYPFANAAADEWLTGGAADGLLAGPRTNWGYQIVAQSDGQGYCRVTLRANPPQVQAGFVIT